MMEFGGWFRSRVLKKTARPVQSGFEQLVRAAGVGGALLATTFVSGCGFTQNSESWDDPANEDLPMVSALEIDAPVLGAANPDLLSTPEPLSVLNEDEIEFSAITLQSAVQTALTNSKILRDLGGSILRAPGAATSTYDVALQEMDPRFGVAGALSAFDASFASEAFFDKNDRSINNQFFGGGTRQLKQDLGTTKTSLTKTGATGTQYILRNETSYDSNNAPGNRFASVFETWIDAEVRHPLLQGGGADFNRIAGPNGSAGALNGVVLARLNTDITQADFEIAVRDFVSNVENAYWDLYYAYRELDARIVARDAALETWNSVHALYETGRAGGEAEKEAQAREQYHRFQQQVQDSLSGRLVEGTQTNNGSGGGSFRGIGGVMVAERRLRLLLGIDINDGTLLRPQDEPIEARVSFDWGSSLQEALSRRSELRRQKWLVTRREQELQASKSFLLPTLDIVGRYRWRGLGKHLLPHNDRDGTFANAVENLTLGKTQEWQLGFEFEMPFGRRQAFAAVEHAELQLARDRAVLGEQEREVVHQLSNSVAEMNRAYATLETSGDRRLAATQQLEAVQAAYSARKVEFDLLLDAQRRHMEAEVTWYKSLCEYSVSIRNVHYAKGSLLDYNEVYLTEDTWPIEAYSDAKKRAENRIPAEWLQHYTTSPDPVVRGEYYQNMENQPIYDESVVPQETAPEVPAVDDGQPASEEENAASLAPDFSAADSIFTEDVETSSQPLFEEDSDLTQPLEREIEPVEFQTEADAAPQFEPDYSEFPVPDDIQPR